MMPPQVAPISRPGRYGRPPGDSGRAGNGATRLRATGDLVGELADMLCHRRGEHLEARASQAEGGPVSSCAASLEDFSATGPPSQLGSLTVSSDTSTPVLSSRMDAG